MSNLDEIKEILDLVKAHDLAEFELERNGLKIRVRKDAAVPVLVHSSAAPVPEMRPGAPAVVAPSGRPEDAPGAEMEAEAIELAVVKSPIVGTFFRAAEPGAPPFVDIGMRVHKGQVLCIIEAMKLMNEIECEYDGELASVYVDNGQPVQYGERLFAIKVV